MTTSTFSTMITARFVANVRQPTPSPNELGTKMPALYFLDEDTVYLFMLWGTIKPHSQQHVNNLRKYCIFGAFPSRRHKQVHRANSSLYSSVTHTITVFSAQPNTKQPKRLLLLVPRRKNKINTWNEQYRPCFLYRYTYIHINSDIYFVSCDLCWHTSAHYQAARETLASHLQSEALEENDA